MRTSIDSQRGVVSEISGNGITIEGKEYHEAPFDERWDDLSAIVYEGTGPAALTYEAYRDTGFFMRFFRDNQNDQIFMAYQMPHGWDPSTAVRPHMHYYPMASGSGVLVFEYAYSWTLVNNGPLGPGSSWTSGSVSASLTPADQYVQKIMSFGTLTPPSGAHESAVLVFKASRPGVSDPTDTYETSKDHGTAAANIGILYFDLHYQKEKAGTVTPFPEG
jgi:hypothetical protein